MAEPINSKHFNQTANFVSQHFVIELAADVGLDDILIPDFWKSASSKLHRLDVVTLLGGRDGLDIDIRIVAVGLGYCVARVIREMPKIADVAALDEGDQADRTAYIPGKKWAAYHGGDLVSSGHSSRADAEAALADAVAG